MPLAPNALAVTVDSGPLDETGKSVNATNSLYATVTVCQPGSTSNCITIDHVLVDTGSTGLRLLSSLLPSSLNLIQQNSSSGRPVLNCAQFVDTSFAWGTVKSADVKLGAKTALGVPIQAIGDPSYDKLSGYCQSGAGSMSTIAALGAKGILGLGLFQQDCGSTCAPPGNANNGVYFACTSTSCAGVAVSTANQLQNPVILFATDNNGLMLSLPAVPTSTNSLSGLIYFGVATQTNNQLSSTGKVLTTDAFGDITTTLQGASTGNSYLDSGSNGIFFNTNAMPSCSNALYSGFYCPTTLTPFTATLSVTPSTATASSVNVVFAVDNAAGNNVFGGSASWSVFPTLAGPSGPATYGLPAAFDWGLPFFFGKNVFIGFEGSTSPLGGGTYFAF